MIRLMRMFGAVPLAMGVLAPIALAQRPHPPAPPTSGPTASGAPSRPETVDPSSSQPVEANQDLVMFLRGRVLTGDGSPVPKDLLVERVCNATVRQQVYATPSGDFNMQMGSMADSYLDASGQRETIDDRLSPNGVTNKVSATGISERELRNCELRASVSGFQSSVVSLVGLHASSGSVDIGTIFVQRTAKVKGMTLNAAAYKAPSEARKAYEKGLKADRNNRLAEARLCFEKAVKIYPKYASAWFLLGSVLQKQDQNDAARTAYTQAATIDTKFLPPYLSLASMAYQAQNWTEVRDFTGHILDLDPLNYARISGDILDLDPLNYTEIYFYNAFANYKLNRIEEAEKSGLRAERLDLRTHFPQVHLLLAEIFARKKNYASAISEMQTYLDLASPDKDLATVRGRLAELEKLNASNSAIN